MQFAVISRLATIVCLSTVNLAGCGGASSAHTAAQEAKVLALLGDAEVTNLNLNAGDGSPESFEKLGDFMKTVRAAPSTVAGKVAACRAHPAGAHCEFLLANPVPVDEALLQQLGTPDADSTKRYSFQEFDGEAQTLTYGKLQLGVAEGQIFAVEVLR